MAKLSIIVLTIVAVLGSIFLLMAIIYFGCYVFDEVMERIEYWRDRHE